MLKTFPILPKALGLAAALTLAFALSAAPAWAGTITTPPQVSFTQGSGLGMGNFNFGSGSLFQPGGNFSLSTFTLSDGADSNLVTPDPVSAPEPATWLLLAAGLAALGLTRRRPAREA